jgi:hypothetical protein
MMRGLGTLVLLSSLAGCVTIADSLLLHIPVNVRVIHSDRTASGEKGHYAYASQGEEPNVRDTADLVVTENWSIGIAYRSRETIEWMGKDLAFRNESDIVVIRPSDALDRVVWKLRAEVWRTKGYTQRIEDDVPKPGTTLIPPPSMTYKIRVQNIEECAWEAGRLHSQALTEQDVALIAGRDTAAFVVWPGYARRDAFWRPTQLGVEGITRPMIRKDDSDRYVACLMKRSYIWP